MERVSHILLIEDDPGFADVIRDALEVGGYEVTLARDGDEGFALARKNSYDALLTDFQMPGRDGLDIVRKLHEEKPHLPVILMTAHHSTDVAIQATRQGAWDYLMKPFPLTAMLQLIERAVQCSRLAARPVEIEREIAEGDSIIGRSPAMQEIYKEIGRVAAKPVTVLIRGESGAGKELVARALVRFGDRLQKPFVIVNCAAIPETLLESELFGHEKGAFTGADARRIGRFEQADKGTLFLDEIGELSMGTQAKLLRVLQEKTISRVGGRENIEVDVRVIAATHVDLEAAITARRFREDLFYRLNVVTLTLPPLRDRREDIPLLAQYFLRRHGEALQISHPVLQPEALAHLEKQAWPGNVRQLENVLRKALLSARGYPIGIGDLEKNLRAQVGPAASAPVSWQKFVTDTVEAASRGEVEDALKIIQGKIEEEALRHAIELAEGNQAKAARWLGISLPTMREKLRHYALHPKQESED
ncbi:MAG TPA: sigma-54 dependent transcriptional regulator [Candidatus Methylacidiphilales bacterium]|jgi:nitrogen regulation protein NR(I)|nr:sigma-54 dependent transcriptional regulator [Candidatus Methylacidiphilales bacterium]